MDIFTILVFFLMVNASDVQVLQNNKDIELPKSVSKETAQDNLIITINSNSVLLQGRKIVELTALKNREGIVISELSTELEYQKSKRGVLSEETLANGLSINIMADKSVPYELLKKIMQTSASSGYTNISLVVEQTQGVSDKELLEVESTATDEVDKS